MRHSSPLTRISNVPLLLFVQLFVVSRFHPSFVDAVKCLDCVGEDCMGAFCHGDVCVLSYYAARWGTVEWGTPRVVKGCLSGNMVRADIKSHCEASDAEGDDVFTCFCNTDHCNGKAVRRLEVEQVELIECVCEGPHCKGSKTCLGELCSHVTNHQTKQVEQGCVNASVPLVERRSAGACMIPPITGAMHHTVAKDAKDLMKTESCVCGTAFCNEVKPKTTVKENEKCKAFVEAEVMGTKMSASSKKGCTGEYCFKAEIKSSLGHMSSYRTAGCASFDVEAMLAEELNPTGCAKFMSENLQVEACFQTKDRAAISRAKANQQVREPPARSRGGSNGRAKGSPRMEITTFDNDEEEMEDERRETEDERREKGKSTEREEEDTYDSEKAEGENEEPEATTKLHFIFERPTLPPEPEDSNTALIAVFLLIILLIVLSALVWKFELHKKLFRANYDVVAGG